MRVTLLLLLFVLAVMIAFGSWRHSPTADEPSHLVAGAAAWRTGRFDVYRVNPPLVRMIASVPLTLRMSRISFESYSEIPGVRSEFGLGTAFLADYKSRALWMLTQTRWMCLPFALLGACTCYRWATDLYGGMAGLLATALWCFSPMVLAHGQLITADVAAASVGATAAYFYWRWLTCPSCTSACCAGVMLGLAELTKFTLIVFIPLWPLIWLVRRKREPFTWRGEVIQLGLMMLVAWYVVSAGYGFEDVFTPLKNYQFVSRTFGGNSLNQRGGTANRFEKSWVGNVPLPRNYLLGVDAQRKDFEVRTSSYMNGRWRAGGWWYYYLYALAVKEPLGVWGLAGIAFFWSQNSKATRRDEMLLLWPLVAIIVLVSSQTGFSHHPRYILPIYPFAFIWISRVAAQQRRNEVVAYGPAVHCQVLRPGILVGLLTWAITSSLSIYPHSLSYFNELAGGPLGGPKCLLASSTDWGQDLIYLREWLDNHPEVDDFRLAWAVRLVNPAIVDIDVPPPPTLHAFHDADKPMWCLLSVNELYAEHGKFAYVLELKPTAIIGYAIYVYRLE